MSMNIQEMYESVGVKPVVDTPVNLYFPIEGEDIDDEMDICTLMARTEGRGPVLHGENSKGEKVVIVHDDETGIIQYMVEGPDHVFRVAKDKDSHLGSVRD